MRRIKGSLETHSPPPYHYTNHLTLPPLTDHPTSSPNQQPYEHRAPNLCTSPHPTKHTLHNNRYAEYMGAPPDRILSRHQPTGYLTAHLTVLLIQE